MKSNNQQTQYNELPPRCREGVTVERFKILALYHAQEAGMIPDSVTSFDAMPDKNKAYFWGMSYEELVRPLVCADHKRQRMAGQIAQKYNVARQTVYNWVRECPVLVCCG
jgi:hypothetical protein